MKIACLLGSPRPDGNSSLIAKRLVKTAEGLGAETTTFVLNELSSMGCQGCYVCKTKLDKCVLKDDMEKVLDTVQQADALVLASPVYYGDITSQLKCFVDRSFSYLKPDYITNPQPSRLAPGKKMVFISTQGNPDEKWFDDIFRRYEFFFKWYGYTEISLIRACGFGSSGVINITEDYLKKADEAARALMRPLTTVI
jgi:multimeric flavodoxin WrbA